MLNARTIGSLFLLLAVGGAGVAAERTPTEQEFRDGDAQMAAMKRDKPDEYRMLIVGTQMALGAFGSGTGPFDGHLDQRTMAAIEKYRRVRGLPKSGSLDTRTFTRIMDDFKLFQMNTFLDLLPHAMVLSDGWDDGYVKAAGTWTIEGQESAWPVQTSEISCYRSRSLCVEATACLQLENRYLFPLVELHDIERWDQHEIVTRPTRSAVCIRETFRIGRVQQSVTGLRLRVSD